MITEEACRQILFIFLTWNVINRIPNIYNKQNQTIDSYYNQAQRNKERSAFNQHKEQVKKASPPDAIWSQKWTKEIVTKI